MDHPEKQKSFGDMGSESELQKVITWRKWWAANKLSLPKIKLYNSGNGCDWRNSVISKLHLQSAPLRVKRKASI